MLVCLDSPLDQAFASKPQTLFGRAVESATAEPHNPHILRNHLAAAAFELRLDPRPGGLDRHLFGIFSRGR